MGGSIVGTMTVRHVYNSGCIVAVQFADCWKEGFVRFPSKNGDRLTLEIEQQRQMPLYIENYPDNWSTETIASNGGLRSMKCRIIW